MEIRRQKFVNLMLKKCLFFKEDIFSPSIPKVKIGTRREIQTASEVLIEAKRQFNLSTTSERRSIYIETQNAGKNKPDLSNLSSSEKIKHRLNGITGF